MICKEEIFYRSFVRKLPVLVIFTPFSNSYLKYGKQLIIEGVFDKTEQEQLITNYYSKKQILTQGFVKAKELTNFTLTPELSIELLEAGFNTEEVFEIASR